MKPDIKKKMAELLKKNIVSVNEELEAATILTWLRYSRQEAEKVSERCVKSLVKQGFVKDDLLVVDKEYLGLWFALAVFGAKGEVRMKYDETEEQVFEII